MPDLRILLPSVLVLSSVSAVAQERASTRQFREVVVEKAKPGELVCSTPQWSKAVARGRDGAWWLMLGRHNAADEVGVREVRWRVELWRSPDGMVWERRAIVPLDNASCGSIVADTLTSRLHLLVAVTVQGKWSEPWHVAYDVETGDWAGKPSQLAVATGDEDQYFANDIDCTESGALVAIVGSHRMPKPPEWTCGWSSALRCRKPGETEWSQALQINVANYGVGSNLSVRGDLVDCSYRTCPSSAVIAVRTYDANTRAFLQSEDEVANGALEGNNGVCNSSAICDDATGGRYVMFVVGGWEPGAGRLCVTYCGPGATEWRSKELAVDPPLKHGNESYSHFALARGAGNQVVAFYSKSFEEHANLHQRLLDGGELVGEESVVSRDRPGAFQSLSGNKQTELRPGIQLVATRGGEALSRASVMVYGVLPAPMPKPRVVR